MMANFPPGHHAGAGMFSSANGIDISRNSNYLINEFGSGGNRHGAGFFCRWCK
jgi:hypothetical protein